MRLRRVARVLLVGLIAAWGGAPAPAAAGGAARWQDEDGVVHLTNVPEDPRYRRRPGFAADIQEISRRHGLSAALVEAVVRAESAFDPSARSPRGAAGLMQLMPRTAAALGVADPFDARENLDGGIRHLRYLLDRYRGNVPMALAAYNADEVAVDTHHGIPPFPETRAYVRTVLELAGLSNTPIRPDRHNR